MDIQKEIDYLQTLEAELRQRSTAILSHYAEGADPHPHMIPAKLHYASTVMRELADSIEESANFICTDMEATK